MALSGASWSRTSADSPTYRFVLAPYHQFAKKIPTALQKEVASISNKIAAGKIKTPSKSTP